MAAIRFKGVIFVVLSLVVFETHGELQAENAECQLDINCQGPHVCVNGVCQEPCTLCGNNTDCHILGKTPLCLCKPCFTGDPLDGCSRSCEEECKVDEDCGPDKSCQEGLCKCPCSNTCGEHTECRVKNHHAICTCKINHTWYSDTSCVPIESPPECHTHEDCRAHQNCQIGKCQDACEGVCGVNAVCRAANHLPACACSPGHSGDPFAGCKPKCYAFEGSYTNRSYLLVQVDKTREEAFLDCKSRGMSLVSITSFEEQVAVKEFVTLHNHNLDAVWTSGIYVLGGSVVWARPYNRGAAVYTSWKPYTLDSYDSGACVFLQPSSGYSWSTWACVHMTTSFLCEEECS